MTQEKTVNGGAREVADTADYVINTVLSVWGALPIELKVYLLTMFTVSIVLQSIKKAFLSKKPRQEKIRLLWVASIPVSLGLASVGWYLSGGVVRETYWVIIGLTAGTVSMGVHRVAIDSIWPFIKNLKNISINFNAKSDRR